MDLLERILKFILVTFLAIMTITVVAQIFSRYVLKYPLGWSEEVTRYLFIYVTFIAAAVGVRKNIHIGVDILSERLTGVARITLHYIVGAFVIVFLLCLIYYGTVLTLSTWDQNSPALALPIGLIYAAIPIGALFSLFFTIENLILNRWGSVE